MLWKVSRPRTLWLIGDGKPGHENQSLGLAEAMARQHPCEIHWISLAGAGGLIGRLQSAFSQASRLPKPDGILAAGHATHASLFALGWRYRAVTVVLMKPSLPMGCFDLCLAPEHDFPNGANRKNLVLTRGAINRIRPSEQSATGRLVLLGGPSKVHSWDSEEMTRMLADICDGGVWEVTDSRRTPDGLLQQIGKRIAGVVVYAHQQTEAGWLPEKLAAAGEVWVTEDSVSMVYEALSSGARVGLLPVPANKKEGRVQRGITGLVQDGYLTRYDAWRENRVLANPPQSLNEADRCADIVWGVLRS